MGIFHEKTRQYITLSINLVVDMMMVVFALFVIVVMIDSLMIDLNETREMRLKIINFKRRRLLQLHLSWKLLWSSWFSSIDLMKKER